MAVRNKCVARGAIATGASATYTVPAGYAFILKDIRLENTGASAGTVAVYLLAAEGGGMVLSQQSVAAYPTTGGWSGWLVMNAGDTLQVQASGLALWYWVSGAVLPVTSP